MTMNEAIRQAMKSTNTKQLQLAERLGVKGQSVIANRLAHPNLSVNTALEMLESMGYEIVVQEKKRGRRPEGQMAIERGEEE